MLPELAPVKMINVEVVIRHFWPKALRTIQEWGDVENDGKALRAVADRSLPTRQGDLRGWLQSWRVFLGLTNMQRDKITEAALAWADARVQGRDLTSPESMAAAHAELMDAIHRSSSDLERRDFTSLASKVLWLCYPHKASICDSYAMCALYVISKLEDGLAPIAEEPKYYQFVSVWKNLYTRYESTIESLDMGTYTYRVRVFDRILWLIGQPYYTDRLPKAPPAA